MLGSVSLDKGGLVCEKGMLKIYYLATLGF